MWLGRCLKVPLGTGECIVFLRRTDMQCHSPSESSLTLQCGTHGVCQLGRGIRTHLPLLGLGEQRVTGFFPLPSMTQKCMSRYHQVPCMRFSHLHLLRNEDSVESKPRFGKEDTASFDFPCKVRVQ